MKKIMAKVGTYEKEGQTKGRYQQIGIIKENSNGEYVMIDPGVDLAGVALKQYLMNPDKAGRVVMASVFEDEPRQQRQQGGGDPKPSRGNDDFDDSIPF